MMIKLPSRTSQLMYESRAPAQALSVFDTTYAHLKVSHIGGSHISNLFAVCSVYYSFVLCRGTCNMIEDLS